MKDKLLSRQEILDSVRASVSAAPPYPASYKPPQRKKATLTRRHIAAAICLSDLHVGEVVQWTETEGFGEYSFDIATRRLMGILEDFAKYVDVQRSGYIIDECHVLQLADYVSGNIHEELTVTNEFPWPVQCVKAGRLLGEFVRRLASHFQHIYVRAVGADNHGRLTKKVQYKQAPYNNASFVVHTIEQAYIRGLGNVTFEEAQGQKMLAPIMGKVFLLEHGHLIRGWVGIPWYGVERLQGREALRRMGTNKIFNSHVFGHFHTSNFLYGGRTITNGSLSGTDELDHGGGRFSGPSQTSFLVSPKHGAFNATFFSRK